MKELNKFYKESPALYEKAFSADGFEWIHYGDHENSVISYIRKGHDQENDLIVVCNFTSVVRKNYKLGLPRDGKLKQVLNSDFKKFFGSGVSNSKEITLKEEDYLGKPYCCLLYTSPSPRDA